MSLLFIEWISKIITNYQTDISRVLNLLRNFSEKHFNEFFENLRTRFNQWIIKGRGQYTKLHQFCAEIYHRGFSFTFQFGINFIESLIQFRVNFNKFLFQQGTIQDNSAVV